MKKKESKSSTETLSPSMSHLQPSHSDRYPKTTNQNPPAPNKSILQKPQLTISFKTIHPIKPP